MKPLIEQLSNEEAHTYSLVLTAAGIGNRVRRVEDSFRIDVPEPLVDAALYAIRCYVEENPPVAPPEVRVPAPSLAGNLSGVAVALVLLCVHVSVMSSTDPSGYVDAFGANARRIMSGEYFRCATALILHADDAHIAGNMAGAALFGGAVCAATGAGVGWLMILACGIGGNLINAWLYQTGHLSIGASTAVFGAVGMLCASQAMAALFSRRGWKRMTLAIGAGLALLAFLGASARSDVGAHLFGFLCGLPAGAVWRFTVADPPGVRVQVLCGAIAALILLAAWIQGAAVS